MATSTALATEAASGPDAPSRLRIGRIFRKPPEAEAAWPPLTLRVGVTGHRADVLPPGESLAEQIRRVLSRLADLAHELNAAEPEAYPRIAPTLRVVSPLASGADQLVAREGLRQGYQLHAPLPFAVKDYVKDFPDRGERRAFRDLLRQAHRVLQLDGVRASDDRAAAYQEVGRVVLRHSDVLVAVWDGEQAHGVGGTGQIVQEAALLEIPVIRIDAAFPHEVYLATASEAEHSTGASLEPLKKALAQHYALADDEQRKRLLRFYRERPPRLSWSWAHPAWASFVTLGMDHAAETNDAPPAPEAAAATPPESAPPSTSSPGRPASPARDALLERVDRLASHYAGVYRTAFLANFLLAALAVFLALIGYAGGNAGWASGVGAAELVTVGIILLVTLWGARAHWHARWLDYRLLAERLRQVEITGTLGRVPAAFRTSIDDADDDPRRDWTAWLLRAVVREGGFPCARMDRGYLEGVRRTLVELIDRQLEYHRDREHLHEAMHHRLHIVGAVLFISTAVAISVHLFGDHLFGPGPVHEWAVPVTTFLAVFLPATGAAIAGIHGQGEYFRTALQSKAMTTRLSRLRADAEKTDAALSSQGLGQTVERVTELMSDELLGWRVVFRGKPLDLPS